MLKVDRKHIPRLVKRHHPQRFVAMSLECRLLHTIPDSAYRLQFERFSEIFVVERTFSRDLFRLIFGRAQEIVDDL